VVWPALNEMAKSGQPGRLCRAIDLLDHQLTTGLWSKQIERQKG